MTAVTPAGAGLRYTMATMAARYQLPPGATLRVTASSGDVRIIAEDRPDVEAPEGARLEAEPDAHRQQEGAEPGPDQQTERKRRRKHKKVALRILRALTGIDVFGAPKRHREQPPGPVLSVRTARGGSRDVLVRCPTGTPVSVGTMSGDVRLDGRFGPSTVTTMSGDVYVDRAAALDVRSVSGDLEVTGCDGLCRLHTKSGEIEAAATGPADASTISGGIHLHRTAGGVTVRTVSGDVELGTNGTDPVKVRTVSGGITVNVATGRLPLARLHSLTGSVECDCPQGSDFPLTAESVSGDIEVGPS